ncbi:MAG: YceH family protein, partial [Acidobacteria bacterium]|nr:YceH family protein [Acidobacteriota bacterium]
MNLELDAAEVRVLGSLMEKEITTPEYYPLSLNALVNACNQKSNRDPVVSYDEDTVAQTLDSLRAKGLALITTGREM